MAITPLFLLEMCFDITISETAGCQDRDRLWMCWSTASCKSDLQNG